MRWRGYSVPTGFHTLADHHDKLFLFLGHGTPLVPYFGKNVLEGGWCIFLLGRVILYLCIYIYIYVFFKISQYIYFISFCVYIYIYIYFLCCKYFQSKVQAKDAKYTLERYIHNLIKSCSCIETCFAIFHVHVFFTFSHFDMAV